MNGPGAAQPGGSLTGTLAQFFRRSGSLATGMVALEDRNIQYRTQPGSQEASLLECFRTELTGEIKESFLKHYKNAKEYGLSHPLSYLDPGLLEEGVSVGYCEVFEEENSDLFTVSIDGQVYLFDDQYCIDPECDCQETVISVIKIAGAKAEHCGTVIVTHEGCCQVLDGRDNLGIVRQWLKEKDPVELLEQRYKKMKEIGRNLKREVAAQKAVERSKANPGRNKAVVGRNDPCPCGSGKKYKKCCG